MFVNIPAGEIRVATGEPFSWNARWVRSIRELWKLSTITTQLNLGELKLTKSELIATNLPHPTAAQHSAKLGILIISYLFPPAGGIAVQRALSLAKYLPASGFEVHILRASNAAAPVMDPALCRHVPKSVSVHSAFTPEIGFWLRHTIWNWLSQRRTGSTAQAGLHSSPLPNRGLRAFVAGLFRRILCPEPEVLWFPFAVRQANRVVRQHAIDVVMVTAPPFSAFLVGNALKRRFPHLKYVADFRDEWISFYLKDFEFQSSEHTRRRAMQVERDTVESADLVVAVTESSLQEIRNRHPGQPNRKFRCISNGFDPEAFKDYRPRQNREKHLVVTHVGTVYRTASPQYYLDALDELPEEIRSGIESRFIGRIDEAERHQFEGRMSIVRVLGFMPQIEALRVMEETDCLLLTMTNEISVPGKLYEYLAARKPIIALSPQGGEVQKLMSLIGAGWCVDYRKRTAIQSLMRHLYLEKATCGCVKFRNPDAEVVRQYDRSRLVANYASSLASILSR